MCHLLLQLLLVKSTRDYIILSLDGSRQEDGTRATEPSILDHYILRPNNRVFECLTLLSFAQNYLMPKELGNTPKHQKMKIVSVRPYCSPDPDGPKYEQYCQQRSMLHVPFRHANQLKGSYTT